MKRWNGWGNVNTDYPLSQSALLYLKSRLGDGDQTPDIGLDQVLSEVPASRLEDHPIITTDPEERLRHARGQSLPDWVALKSGQILTYPDGIAHPETNEDIRELYKYAKHNDVHLIPYGGGTSVVGHITPIPSDQAILTVDLSRFNKLVEFDNKSDLATIEAGIRGPELERKLRSQGFTLGHFPQSFEYSTLGGWIATRSSGQQSYYYGRIEDTFAGGHIECPEGQIDLNPVPASAAGPDLRHIFLGSEGCFGIITQATMRVRKIPEVEGFYGVFFSDWENGVSAVKQITQAGIQVSMLRLSDPFETESTFKMSGKDKLATWAGRMLKIIGFGSTRCMLIFGVTGDAKKVNIVLDQTNKIIRSYGGINTGLIIGNQWEKTRFLTPYLRNTLWEKGFAVDTLETAVSWKNLSNLIADIHQAIQEQADQNQFPVLMLTHLSHVYRNGASIYITYLFPRLKIFDELLLNWQAMKSAASKVIISNKATISHQHGIGKDHLPYMTLEKGYLGIEILKNIKATCDPNEILNPNVLITNND